MSILCEPHYCCCLSSGERESFMMRTERERARAGEEEGECFPSFALSRSVLHYRFFAEGMKEARRTMKEEKKNPKENRDISARASARRTETSTVGHSRDVVFYASVIVVVILVGLSRDVGRRYYCFFVYFFFFSFLVVIVVDVFSLLFVLHTLSVNDVRRTRAHTRARALILLPPSSPSLLNSCSMVVVGKRAR